MIDTFGNDKQRDKFLPKLASMEVCDVVKMFCVMLFVCLVFSPTFNTKAYFIRNST